MRKSFISVVVGTGIAASMTLTASVTFADTQADRAKADYMSYCASCHGEDGTGKGPLASELKKSPTDLTQLTKESGHFPYLQLRKVIDGSDTAGSIRSHGTTKMPVWGNVFRKQAGSHPWSESQARIMNIVDYLASIQK